MFGHGRFGGQATLPARDIFVPYNGKIADITHADTNAHFLALAAPLAETRIIVAVVIYANRAAGGGGFLAYPNEGTNYINCTDAWDATDVLLATGTNRLQYSLTQANDDFDLYCVGYVVRV